MDQPDLAPPTLFDLLARQWRRPAAIAGLAFNGDQSAVAFVGADGSLAVAAMADPEPPAKRVRTSTETGRATIRPREKPVRPAVVVAPVDDRAPPIAAHRHASFAVAGHDGRVLAITPRGQVLPFEARLGERVTTIAGHAATRRIACAAGGELAVFPVDDTARPQRLRHDRAITTLAFSPDGASLAGTHAAGVCLWRLDRVEPPRELAFAGEPVAVAWSPGGDWLACPLADEGFQLVHLADGSGGAVLGYPTPMRSLAWSRPADAIVTAGAYRAAAWSMAHPPQEDATTGALQTGRPGLVVVERVAAHPSRDLVAVGYANGQVGVMRLGHRDELLVRQDGGGAVTALAWSDDGQHLALGTAGGLAAVVGFPPHLFK
jgi:WD40 repeat protein